MLCPERVSRLADTTRTRHNGAYAPEITMRWTHAALLWTWASSAHAASRVVFQLAAPVNITMDGAVVTPSGDRAIANGVSPGLRRVQVRSADGRPLRESGLDVEDGQSVTVMVQPDGSLVVKGAGARVRPLSGEGESSNGSVVGAAAASDPKAEDPGTGSFDLNEGDQAANVRPEGPAGDFAKFANGVSTAGRVAGGVVAPGASAIAGVAAPVVVRGATGVVQNAKAGGLNDLRSGPAQGRQGTARAPKVVTGLVKFEAAEGDPYLVFAGGMQVAEVPGGGGGSAKIPVGRQPLELWDADTGTVRWKGILEVVQDQPITLKLSDAAAPQAVERAWAWSNR